MVMVTVDSCDIFTHINLGFFSYIWAMITPVPMKEFWKIGVGKNIVWRITCDLLP